LKKWISRFVRKRDAAMEWTGASPQRYKSQDMGIKGIGGWGVYFVEEAACFIEVLEVC